MKIFGIPISVDVSFFMIVGVLGMNRLTDVASFVQWIVVVFVSVVIHELGHALAGRLFGLTPQIHLYGMGGLTSWSATREIGPARRIAISLAGPFAGFAVGAIAIVGYLATGGVLDPRLLPPLLSLILWVNIAWGILNLLPILPLDGGNVVRSTIELITRRPGDRPAQVLSVVVAALVAVLALRFGQIWSAFLAIWFGYSNVTALMERSRESEDATVLADLDAAWREVEEGRGADAVEAIERVQRAARSKSAKRRAAEALVYAHLQSRDAERATKAFGTYVALYGAHPYLEGAIALERGDAERAMIVLEPLFNEVPVARVGRELCRAYVRTGRDQKALALCTNPSTTAFAGELYTTICEETYRAGRYSVSAEAGAEAVARTGDPMTAYNVACALACDRRDDEALEWLDRAVELGFNDVALIRDDADLDALRSRDELRGIVEKLETIERGVTRSDPADSQVP